MSIYIACLDPRASLHLVSIQVFPSPPDSVAQMIVDGRLLDVDRFAYFWIATPPKYAVKAFYTIKGSIS